MSITDVADRIDVTIVKPMIFDKIINLIANVNDGQNNSSHHLEIISVKEKKVYSPSTVCTSIPIRSKFKIT